MELFYRKLGKGKPLIVLHGLYGSSDNWYTLGSQLASFFEVYLVDQRNHGRSPHDPVHNYYALRDDLHEFIVQHSLYRPSLLGHSMGGRTAMYFALAHPRLIDKLCVVDISPCTYPPESHSVEMDQHAAIIHAMRSMDLGTITSRKDADKHLAKTITSPLIRMFLLKNLKLDHHNSFSWGLNLETLSASLPAIFTGIEQIVSDDVLPPAFPTLFIRGELSGYIGERDLDCVKRYFPEAVVVTIPRAGHWLHAENPGLFLESVKQFLLN